MDFHTLSRKELQALSKKNKIPANITNVAMADALSALPQVEGLDEILNPKESGDIGTPSIQIRSASRTTTQRKAVKEAESSKVSTRPSRVTRTRVAEGVVEQENKDANMSATPAMVPSSRRRVPAVSTRRKKEVVEDGDDGKNGVQEKPKDVPKTPAVAPSSRKRVTDHSVRNKNETPSGTSVQKGYSTRRSVRLLGKSLSEMSLVDTEDMGLDKTDDVSEELSSVSQHVEDSSNTEKGASMQTVSTVVSESTEELEVSSLNKADDEGQSHDLCSEDNFVSEKESDVEDALQAEGQSRDLGSEEKLVSGKESAVEDELQAEGQSRELGSEEKLVSGKESAVEDELQAEPQQEGSGEANNVVAEPNDSSLHLTGSFNESGDSNEAGSALLPELEDSGDSAELENNECDETKQDAVSFVACEEASMEVADEKDISSNEEVLENVADNGNYVDNFEPKHDDDDECDDSNEAGFELLPELDDSGDSAKLENKECNETEQGAISFEPCEEASVEIAVKKDGTEEVLENMADDNVNPIETFEPIDKAIDNNVVSSTEEVLENVADDNVNPVENFETIDEAIDNNVVSSTEEDLVNVADGNVNHIENFADKKDVSCTEEVLENERDDNVNQIENFEPKYGDIDEAADNKVVLSTEDGSSANSGTLNKVCLEVEDVAVQLPFLGGVQIAEDQTVISEKLEAEAQAEDSEVAAGDDTLIDDGNAFSCFEDGTQISFSLQQVESDGISNTLVEADGDTDGSSETMTVAQVNEQEMSDVAIEPMVSVSLTMVKSEETKEIQTDTNILKENLIIDFQNMSIRGLKKKLKELGVKPKSMTDNDATYMQEGEKKRTALQALPQNQLTTGEDQKNV